MDATTTAAIFTAASTATSWKRTNLGLSVEVPADGFDWTVRLPQEGHGKAYIAGSSGWGGDTAEYIEATWGDTFAIIDAALAATRLH
ncbi:hypothetical protein ACIOHS_27095 [Streptomyces sp. NPDC088253]|uniref:hypothetical protein n=1 Tax=Streptomyces sp. NPDC088253 TaxID=3365846 RepID=UPI0038131B1B